MHFESPQYGPSRTTVGAIGQLYRSEPCLSLRVQHGGIEDIQKNAENGKA